MRKFIKRILGITALENESNNLKKEVKILQRDNGILKERMGFVFDAAKENAADNRLILHHIKFINSQFSVVSDINMKYEPSVVLIMKKGVEEVVKSYQFNNSTLAEIYRILEGFGKENNRIDKPKGTPYPRFRY